MLAEGNIGERGGYLHTSLLHEAVLLWERTGDEDMLGLLLRQSTLHAVSTEDSAGATPLHYAASRNLGTVVNALLVAGAKVSARDINGETPLHQAVLKGHVEMVCALLHAGADVQSTTRNGKTPRDMANFDDLIWEMCLGKEEDIKAEAVRVAQCEAFAMGLHERLGAGSRVRRWLDADLLKMVLEQV